MSRTGILSSALALLPVPKLQLGSPPFRQSSWFAGLFNRKHLFMRLCWPNKSLTPSLQRHITSQPYHLFWNFRLAYVTKE